MISYFTPTSFGASIDGLQRATHRLVTVRAVKKNHSLSACGRPCQPLHALCGGLRVCAQLHLPKGAKYCSNDAGFHPGGRLWGWPEERRWLSPQLFLIDHRCSHMNKSTDVRSTSPDGNGCAPTWKSDKCRVSPAVRPFPASKPLFTTCERAGVAPLPWCTSWVQQPLIGHSTGRSWASTVAASCLCVMALCVAPIPSGLATTKGTVLSGAARVIDGDTLEVGISPIVARLLVLLVPCSAEMVSRCCERRLALAPAIASALTTALALDRSCARECLPTGVNIGDSKPGYCA